MIPTAGSQYTPAALGSKSNQGKGGAFSIRTTAFHSLGKISHQALGRAAFGLVLMYHGDQATHQQEPRVSLHRLALGFLVTLLLLASQGKGRREITIIMIKGIKASPPLSNFREG